VLTLSDLDKTLNIDNSDPIMSAIVHVTSRDVAAAAASNIPAAPSQYFNPSSN